MSVAEPLRDQHPHKEVLEYLRGWTDWNDRDAPRHALMTRNDLIEGLVHCRDVDVFEEDDFQKAIDEMITAEVLAEFTMPDIEGRYLGDWITVDMSRDRYHSMKEQASRYGLSTSWRLGDGWFLTDKVGAVVCAGSMSDLSDYLWNLMRGLPTVIPSSLLGEFLAKRIEDGGNHK